MSGEYLICTDSACRVDRPESKFVSRNPIVGTNLGTSFSLRSSGINGPKERRSGRDAYGVFDFIGQNLANKLQDLPAFLTSTDAQTVRSGLEARAAAIAKFSTLFAQNT